MKKKNKIAAIVIAICLLFGICAGVGNYFVTYAIARSGDGGNRIVETTEELVLLDEDEAIIEANKTAANEEVESWLPATESNTVTVQSSDDLTLDGTIYYAQEESDQWAIVLHGYRSSPSAVLSIACHFNENGYNVLVPYMRGCGDSEGDYIGMGWLDKEDLKKWIQLILEQDSDAQIVLHGSSMGAATVCMASGEDLPDNVKCIVSDSSYTTVAEIFTSELQARFSLPSFPLIQIFDVVANIRAGYDIYEASALNQVAASETPILFIHGDKDDFVPLSMCYELYEAAACEKEMLIISGAGHTEGKYCNPAYYYSVMDAFISEYIQ